MATAKRNTLLGSIFTAFSLSSGLVAEEHKTGTGLVLKSVNPAGVTISFDGEDIVIPGGAPFAMATHEVTQGQFERLLGHNPAETDAEHLPVDRVTATEAAAFCKALTERDRAAGLLPEGKAYRLPTVREWLLAALPGGLVPSADAVGAIAWHKDNSAGLLHPVGAKTANAYGLHDLIGNAAEWVTPDAALNEKIGAGQPVLFKSQCIVQRHRPGEERTPAFVQTQIAIIKAKATLALAAEELGLAEKWKIDIDQAVSKLKSGIEVEPLRGTDLLAISYRGEDAEEAAKVADAIAKSYRERLNESVSKRAEAAIKELARAAVIQEKKLETSRLKMLKIMEEYNIVDLSLGKPAWLRDGVADLKIEPQPKKEGEGKAEAEKRHLQERRKHITYVESKKDYELNKDVLNSMRSRLARAKIDTHTLADSVVIHEKAVVARTPVRPAGRDTPIAIGGSVYDEPDDLADPTETNPKARTAGAGFRFVLADE